MVTITNRKLADVSPPVWRRYAGLSLLYDDPGSVASPGLQRLGGSSTGPVTHPAYARLCTLAAMLADDATRAGVTICMLPCDTYHVTLCDGVHDGQQALLHPDIAPEVAATLAALPDSLLWANSVIRLLRAPELTWAVWSDPVSFDVDGLDVWGHALVASLVPADPRSGAAKARHEVERRELAARLHARLGPRVGPWRPHVTLGYLAEEADGEHVRRALLPPMQQAAQSSTDSATLTFTSASVHGFTDMVTYWRLGRC